MNSSMSATLIRIFRQVGGAIFICGSEGPQTVLRLPLPCACKRQRVWTFPHRYECTTDTRTFAAVLLPVDHQAPTPGDDHIRNPVWTRTVLETGSADPLTPEAFAEAEMARAEVGRLNSAEVSCGWIWTTRAGDTRRALGRF